MKNKLLLLLFAFLLSITKFFAQEIRKPDGYKLPPSPKIVYAYRDDNGKPDLSVKNIWVPKYWFKVDGTEYVDNKNKKYVRVTIPSLERFNDKSGQWTDTTGYDIKVDWKDNQLVDGSDFNTWLWITEEDYKNKVEYFRPSKWPELIVSGITAPFKLRGPASGQSSAVINGDINLGAFLGARFRLGQKAGINLGGHFGLSSIALNSSNNTEIKDSKTETIQGFTYGAGIIFDLNKSTQLGVVAGWDQAVGNLAKSYVYQDHVWFSFSLNFKFLDFEAPKKSDTNKNNETTNKEKPEKDNKDDKSEKKK